MLYFLVHRRRRDSCREAATIRGQLEIVLVIRAVESTSHNLHHLSEAEPREIYLDLFFFNWLQSTIVNQWLASMVCTWTLKLQTTDGEGWNLCMSASEDIPVQYLTKGGRPRKIKWKKYFIFYCCSTFSPEQEYKYSYHIIFVNIR